MSNYLAENMVNKLKSLVKTQNELIKDIENLSFDRRSKLKTVEEQIKIIQTEIKRLLIEK